MDLFGTVLHKSFAPMEALVLVLVSDMIDLPDHLYRETETPGRPDIIQTFSILNSQKHMIKLTYRILILGPYST